MLELGSSSDRPESSVVLGVKPAIEDVDVYIFLAFLYTFRVTCTKCIDF
jgi:hypothetical protein